MIFNSLIEISKQKKIGIHQNTFIVAEAGVNHGGDVSSAKKLIDVAKEAGVDAVKFQAFKPENLVLSNVDKAVYQKQSTNQGETQFEMLRKLALQKEHYKELKQYAENQNILFLITPYDEDSLAELEEIGILAYKIASTDITNLPFIKKVAQTGKPIILSTGMAWFEEVYLALSEIHPINKNVILLQCTANYPIQDNEANLNVINTYKKNFDIIVGYSDHCVGIGASPYAVALGAKVVEKHFTLDKLQSGPDHKASLDPLELKKFVEEVRRVEKFISDDGLKKPTFSELNTRNSLQKCLVAKMPINKGEVITEHHIVAKRTGGKGISPIYYGEVIGQLSPKNFEIDDIIEL